MQMNEREQLLNKLRAVQFALVDLGLFLDTHPKQQQALEMYKQLSNEQKRLSDLYEQSFGPLTAGGGGNTDYWDWVATPFPWEVC